MRKEENKLLQDGNDTFLHIVFILGVAICLIPLFLILAISFTTESEIINKGYTFWPNEVTLDTYKYLFRNFDMILNGYKNTLITMVVGTVLKLLCVGLYGYVLSRKDFPYRGFFSLLVLITILFSGGLGPSYYMMVKVYKLKNTLTALILSGLGMGFQVFMMKSYYMSNIPFELIESAKIDGAGETRTYFQIVAPMAVPIFATVALMTAISYWNAFQACLLYIEKESLYTIQYAMQRALNNISAVRSMMEAGVSGAEEDLANMPNEGLRMGMAVFAIGPIVLAYPFFQRFFLKGMTVGAVKG